MIRSPRKPVLFSAANLHTGGGVQVAASLADEMMRMAEEKDSLSKFPWLSDVVYELSDEVTHNLAQGKERNQTITINDRGWNRAGTWAPTGRPYDVEFVVFGPRYGLRRGRQTIVGLADVTSVYPRPNGVPRERRDRQLAGWLRGHVSRRIFRRESHLVSESGVLGDAFCRRTGYPRSSITVIPNTVNRAVMDPSLGDQLPLDIDSLKKPGEVILAYVARLYPHKNHEFLADLAEELRLLDVRARFAVTLSDAEWESTSIEFRKVCVNLGVLPVAQIGDLYRQVDAVIFPSLLESFSATPIEALARNGLLFASRRDFVKEFCGDGAIYIDPLDPQESAMIIRSTFADPIVQQEARSNASGVAAGLPTANERARRIVELIHDSLSRGVG